MTAKSRIGTNDEIKIRTHDMASSFQLHGSAMGHAAITPPSTVRILPVVQFDSLEAK
jgi:hypothetical protein